MTGDDGKVAHIADFRPKAEADPVEEVLRAVDLRLAKHFQQQNEVILGRNEIIVAQNNRLETLNQQLSDKVSRLLTGMEALLGEVDAVRTGKSDEAFARVARHDEEADLPTIEADAAILYPYTSGEIGAVLGFGATQIGLLLGAQGLKWAGDSAYQEIGRWKDGRQRYWHKDLPERLTRMLLEHEPDEFGIANKSIRSMFVQFRARHGAVAGA